tara:strand:- start:10 stop:237 length:228 start_codon:yes stop_codon:yes gene_type:complete
MYLEGKPTKAMDIDSQLKDTLHITVSHAVSRMESLKDAKDRRCIFQEYKEWLEEDFSNEVWAIPTDCSNEILDVE